MAGCGGGGVRESADSAKEKEDKASTVPYGALVAVAANGSLGCNK